MIVAKLAKSLTLGKLNVTGFIPLFLAAYVLGGCCAVHTVIPLIKCDPQSSVEFLIDADSDANGGRTTHVRFLIMTKGAAFKSCPTQAIFRQDRERTNDANLGVVKGASGSDGEFLKAEEFVKPGAKYTVRMSLGNIERYKESGKIFIGVIANFADTTAIASNRILTEITKRKTRVEVRISGYTLIGKQLK